MNNGLFGALSGRNRPGAGLKLVWESPANGAAFALGTNYQWTHGLNFIPRKAIVVARNLAGTVEYTNILFTDSIGGANWATLQLTATTVILLGADTAITVSAGTGAPNASIVGTYRPIVRLFN